MASFLLRAIDEELLTKLRARAAAERLTVRELLLKIIYAYVNS